MSIFFSSSKHCQYLYPRKDAIFPEFKGKWLLVEIVALKHSPPQNSEWRIWGEFCLKTALFIQFKAKWHPLNPAICLQKSHGIICTNDHRPKIPRVNQFYFLKVQLLLASIHSTSPLLWACFSSIRFFSSDRNSLLLKEKYLNN